MVYQSGSDLIRNYGPWLSSSGSGSVSKCWHPLLQNRRAHLLPFYAKVLFANCKTVQQVFAHVIISVLSEIFCMKSVPNAECVVF